MYFIFVFSCICLFYLDLDLVILCAIANFLLDLVFKICIYNFFIFYFSKFYF